MKFSIVTPFHSKELASITVQSVKSLDYTSSQYEHIWSYDENKERVFARNKGMSQAKGDWICWLDAGDFYLPYYLTILDQAIAKYPTTRVFNYGGIVTWSRWDNTIRMSDVYHKGDVFRSGTIMSGGFCFHRNCLDEVGLLPEATQCYDLGRAMTKDFPEIIPLYKPGQLDLGNPWGDDWAMFYKLTRVYEPQHLNVSPYVVITREEHQL
jgi:glycosyltransferase involved in cell wall biosynthesis